MDVSSRILPKLPGLALAIAVALVARLLHGLLPKSAADLVGEVVIAIFLGLLVGNLLELPAATRPGIRFSFETLLRLAIVLLGARLSFPQVMKIGGKALLLILVLMTVALLLARWVGKVFALSPKLAVLIGVGTAICGNSAISAVAPVIGAKDEDVSFAIATNTLFGTLAVFLYPLLGHALGLTDAAYGTWAGTAVNDTSQVVAAGLAFSPAAADIATTVKLTRNALMGGVIILLGFLYAEESGRAGGSTWSRLRQSLPPFVVGFLLMALAATFGWLNAPTVTFLSEVAKLLILVALSAVGLSTKLGAMRQIGLKPFYLGLAVAAVTSGLSLLLIHLLGPTV